MQQVQWAAARHSGGGDDDKRPADESKLDWQSKPPRKTKAKAKANGPDHSLFIGEKWTELGNSHRLVHRHGEDIRYVHPLKSWFVWNGTYWKRDDDGMIMRYAEETIESLFKESTIITDDATRQAFRKFALKSQSHAPIRAMVALAQHSNFVIIFPDYLDADSMLLGVLNGVIELATGTFREGQREDYITKQAAVDFNPSSQCPNWIEFQNKIAGGDVKLIAYKQRLFGLLLTGQMVEIFSSCMAKAKMAKPQSSKQSPVCLATMRTRPTLAS